MPLPSEGLNASAPHKTAEMPRLDRETGEISIGALTSGLPAFAQQFGGVSSNMLKANWVLGVAASGKDSAVELSAAAYASHQGQDELASQHLTAAGGEAAEGAGGFAGAWAGATVGAQVGGLAGPYSAVALAVGGGIIGGVGGKEAVTWLLDPQIETGGGPIPTMDRPGLEEVKELQSRNPDLTPAEARAEILQQRAEMAFQEQYVTPREAYGDAPDRSEPEPAENGRDGTAADEQTRASEARDPGPLAGEALPSDSTQEAMSEAWGPPSSSAADAGSGNEPDAVVLPPDPTTPRDNWGHDTDGLDGEGTDWSPDGSNDGYSTTPADNWGEDNEALDGSGTEWSGDGDGDRADSEVGSGAAAAGFGALGRALATESGVDGAGETAALSTVAGTLGQNLGQEIGAGTGFEDFGSDLAGNARSTATGLVAGEVTADLSASLGFDGDGFGDQLGVRMTQHAVSSTIDAGVNAATTGDSLGQSLGESFSPATLGTVAGGFVGSYLAGELLEDANYSADTQTGATVGGVGGAVGATVGAKVGTSIMPVVGTVIGAFVGAVFGTVFGSEFGDLFGDEPPPPPEAEATLSYSVADGFQVSDASDGHGGNAGGMATAAQRAGEVLNTLIEATGGRLKDPASVDDLTIGYSGEHMTVNGREISGPEGVEVLIEEALAG